MKTSRSNIQLWVHFTWSTLHRVPLLKAEIRQQVFSHIRENAVKKGINVLAINGYEDHVHVLIRLKEDQVVAKIAQLLKGESSYWINKEKLLTKDKFNWQRGYSAFSVSRDHLTNLIQYIKNQESIHKNRKAAFSLEPRG